MEKSGCCLVTVETDTSLEKYISLRENPMTLAWTGFAYLKRPDAPQIPSFPFRIKRGDWRHLSSELEKTTLSAYSAMFMRSFRHEMPKPPGKYLALQAFCLIQMIERTGMDFPQ